jgi:hypothetical protein
MQDGQLTEFSGVSGRVLQRSLSAGSLVTGITLGLVLIAGNALFVFAGAEMLGAPFTQIVMALALARFAANGLEGEWSGTVFSTAGGSWGQVALIALRYLALTAFWFVPLLLLGAGLNEGMSIGVGTLSGKAVAVAVIYLVAMTLTPPLFLIVSVRASGIGDVFKPDHWKQSIGSRYVDLFAIYVVYTGALGMVLILLIAPVALALSANGRFGLFLAGVSLCMLFGVSVSLLGRLCGFFACGESGLSSVERAMAPVPQAGLSSPLPTPSPQPQTQPGAEPTTAQPVVASSGAQSEVSADSQTTRDAGLATVPLGTPGLGAQASPPDASGGPAGETASAVQSARPEDPTSSQPPQRTARPRSTPTPVPPVSPTEPSPAAHRPPALDAARRVEAAMKRFNLEPESAVSALQDLRDTFAPDPHVLQALAICMYRLGHIEEALEFANRALPMCFDRGQAKLGARLFSELRPHMGRLDLDSERILFIATTLANEDDLAGAAKAFSALISIDPDETAAVKGLLQVAEDILHKKGKPEAAAKVYRYLMQHCSTSPLVEFMDQGLEEAERQMTHAGKATY